jgi:hypothetical protein
LTIRISVGRVLAGVAVALSLVACSGDSRSTPVWCAESIIVHEPDANGYAFLGQPANGRYCGLMRVDSRGVLRIQHVDTIPTEGLDASISPDGRAIWRATGPVAFAESSGGYCRLFASGYTPSDFATLLASLSEIRGPQMLEFLGQVQR